MPSFWQKHVANRKRLVSLMRSVDWRKAQALAKRYGPAVASIYPPAGMALAAVNGLQSKARAGDPQALANLGKLAVAAKSGDPNASSAVKALATLSLVRETVEA